MSDYPIAQGGLPPQSSLITERAIFTDSYAVIPKGVFSDIVTSYLPHWSNTRLWVIARPMSGFSTTFSQYLMELGPGGGSERPEDDPLAQSVIFVTKGQIQIDISGDIAGSDDQSHTHVLGAGGYAYLPAQSLWSLHNKGDCAASFHWIRKRYQVADGVKAPDAFFTEDKAIKPIAMPDTDGVWSTTRFVDPADIRHDMHVNIVTFKPGGVIPFPETHVMEHGIFILEGKAVYKLNQDWVEVEAGDFLWLRAFCPQACYAGGPGDFRYLLYKDVNRHMPLTY